MLLYILYNMRRILASRKTPFAAKIYRGTQKEKSDSSKNIRLSKKVCSPLGPLCEGAPPAGGGGENCTAARNISGYGKVLSLRPFGAPPSQREVFLHAENISNFPPIIKYTIFVQIAIPKPKKFGYFSAKLLSIFLTIYWKSVFRSVIMDYANMIYVMQTRHQFGR